MDVRKLVLFTTSIPSVDKEHLEFAIVLKELYRLVSQQLDTTILVTKLKNCLVSHFNNEVRIMHHINFPDVNSHELDHNRVLNIFYKITGFFDSERKKLTENDVRRIYSLVLTHMEYQDTLYDKFIKHKKVA